MSDVEERHGDAAHAQFAKWAAEDAPVKRCHYCKTALTGNGWVRHCDIQVWTCKDTSCNNLADRESQRQMMVQLYRQYR